MTQNKWSRRTRAELAIAPLTVHPDGLKTCPACLHTKPIAEYHHNRNAPDALAFYCKPCILVKMAAARVLKPSKSNKAARRL